MAKKPTTPVQKDSQQPDGESLVVMVQDGAAPINVHPTQVGPWQAQGWTVKE